MDKVIETKSQMIMRIAELSEANKRLQAEYDELYKYNVALENDYRDLEQENKQLKKLKFKSDGIELLQDANLNLHNANVKYRQCLQEIREIAEKEIVCEDCNFEGTDKCDARMCTHFYLNDFSKDILDKINEVIGVKNV